MKASELIAKMQSLIWEHGDREVLGWHEKEVEFGGMDCLYELEMQPTKIDFNKDAKCFFVDLEETK